MTEVTEPTEELTAPLTADSQMHSGGGGYKWGEDEEGK